RQVKSPRRGDEYAIGGIAMKFAWEQRGVDENIGRQLLGLYARHSGKGLKDGLGRLCHWCATTLFEQSQLPRSDQGQPQWQSLIGCFVDRCYGLRRHLRLERQPDNRAGVEQKLICLRHRAPSSRGRRARSGRRRAEW